MSKSIAFKGLGLVFSTGLAVAAVCMFSGCGSAPKSPSGPKVVVSGTVQTSVNYTLTAYQSAGSGPVTVTQTLSNKGTANFPATVVATANAGSTNRVTVTLGSQYCDYVNNGSGTYLRQDGSCNTQNPNASVTVLAGGILGVGIQGTAAQDTAVEADLLVTFN